MDSDWSIRAFLDGIVLSGSTISLYFSFLGLLITLIWIFFERWLFDHYGDDERTTTGRAFATCLHHLK